LFMQVHAQKIHRLTMLVAAGFGEPSCRAGGSVKK
jgi:hypothetical protein